MTTKVRFQFGNVVVVDDDLIGVIVKTWENQRGEVSYEVYVRSYNAIKEYPESEIQHYIYNKELIKEEYESYDNA